MCAKLCSPTANSTLLVCIIFAINFRIWTGILHILRQYNIHSNRDQCKLGILKVTVIHIIIVMLGMILRCLLKGTVRVGNR